MKKLFLISALLLSGCMSGLWTGASFIYDRHNIYKQVNDYELEMQTTKALYKDSLLKQQGNVIDVAVFNGDILIAGHVLTRALRDEAQKRMHTVRGYRRLFIQLGTDSTHTNEVLDSWITTQIRSQILADSSINPHSFKVVTIDQIVYLMGDVKPKQAKRVIHIARQTSRVIRVVKLMAYYHLSLNPEEPQKSAPQKKA